jgi:hypothetical protein
MEMLNEINDIGIAQYFNLSEFACPCCKRIMLHPRLLKKLIELRGIVERPVYITSGYRCPEYNQKIVGVVNSYHLIGLAADIRVKDINLIELFRSMRGDRFCRDRALREEELLVSGCPTKYYHYLKSAESGILFPTLLRGAERISRDKSRLGFTRLNIFNAPLFTKSAMSLQATARSVAISKVRV